MNRKIHYTFFHSSLTFIATMIMITVVFILALYYAIFGSEREIETYKRPYAIVFCIIWLILVSVFVYYSAKKHKKARREIKEIITKGKVIEGTITGRDSEEVGNIFTGSIQYYYIIKYENPKTHTIETAKSHYLAVFRNARIKKYPLKVKLYYYKNHIYADEIIGEASKKHK